MRQKVVCICKQLQLSAAYVHVRCGLSCMWKAVESPVLNLYSISVFMRDDLCCDFMTLAGYTGGNATLCTGVSPTLCTGVSPTLCTGVSPTLCTGVSPTFCTGVSPTLCTGVSPTLCIGVSPTLCIDVSPTLCTKLYVVSEYTLFSRFDYCSNFSHFLCYHG